MRASRSLLVLVIAAIGALLASTTVAPADAMPLPVRYDFLSGIEAELADPGGSLPGTNDFDCRPSTAHPRPVILVHGAGGGRQTNWGTLAPVLANAGYCVFALTYSPLPGPWPVSAIGAMGDKVESAWQIRQFADRVRAATGAEQVDIVGHSLGTEIPIYWMKYLGGADAVGTYVSLAPYWRQGPDSGDIRSEAFAMFQDALGIPRQADLGCDGCTEPPADTHFNRAVREPSPYLPGARYRNIVTRYDNVNRDYRDGLLPGPPGIEVDNIVVQDGCEADRSDHMSIVANRRTAALVLGALDPAAAPPVPCVPVAPITGG